MQFGVKEIREISGLKLKESPLGKLVEENSEPLYKNYDVSILRNPENWYGSKKKEKNISEFTSNKEDFGSENNKYFDANGEKSRKTQNESKDNRDTFETKEGEKNDESAEPSDDTEEKIFPEDKEAPDHENNSDNAENGTEAADAQDTPKYRELTEDEKQALRNRGMSESNIEKCLVDENGVIHLRTRNEGFEGKKHPDTGVEYERKRIDLGGMVVEGVFPKFESVFSCILDPENIQASDREQFKDCMIKLREAVDNDPELASKFSKRQLEQIHDPNATTVSGYVWHHNEETGKMELVKSDEHGKTGHTGGKTIWGGGEENR